MITTVFRLSIFGYRKYCTDQNIIPLVHGRKSEWHAIEHIRKLKSRTILELIYLLIYLCIKVVEADIFWDQILRNIAF